ncbi:MAG: alcohol dehydrogenase catalytic domain-containing protein [Eubacteriaceae bacterium]
MKAFILKEKGKLVLREKVKPRCGDNEILIKVKACNVCKTDLKAYLYGHKDLVYPRILGHEISGVIEELGKNIKHYKIGEHVFIHPGISCGKCYYCHQGLDNLCDHIKILGFNFDGGFQEYLLIPKEGVERNIVQIIDRRLKFSEVSFIEPIACCLNIQDQLDFTASPQVLIIGGGRLGLLNLLIARAKGAQKIFLIEPIAARGEMALSMGCDGILSSCEDIPPMDIVIPCCSDPNAFNLALKCVRKKGQIGYFSGILGLEDRVVELNLIHYKEILVFGSYGCRLKQSIKGKELLEKKLIDVSPLISNKISLEDLEKGFDYIKNLDGFSTIIKM